jgi:hypothetical protein
MMREYNLAVLAHQFVYEEHGETVLDSLSVRAYFKNYSEVNRACAILTFVFRS